MIEHDFSQLPVVDDAQCVRGLVTQESLLRALTNLGVRIDQLTVNDALVRATSFHPEEDLFDALDRLRDTNAVLIVDAARHLLGIVTSYDTTEFFRQRTEDLMWVEDVEGAVKELIEAPFADKAGDIDHDELNSVLQDLLEERDTKLPRYEEALRRYLELSGHDKNVRRQWLEESYTALASPRRSVAFGELTLYQYENVLLNEARWPAYARFLRQDRAAIRTMLDGVRTTRNQLAHFRGFITPMQRAQLRDCAEWFGRHSGVDFRKFLEEDVPSRLVLTSRSSHVAVPTAGKPKPLRGDASSESEVEFSRDSRYAGLAQYLRQRPPGEETVTLSFEQVEGIIDAPLPVSARQHRAWWANDQVAHVQSRQWLAAGWRVAQVSLDEGPVVFARIRKR
jgi:hypothetical protein